MAKRNVSELFDFRKIYRYSGDQKLYWLGGDHWSTDPSAPGVVVRHVKHVDEHFEWLSDCYDYTCAAEECDHYISVIHWDKNEGIWGIVNPITCRIHKVSMVGNYGEGFYYKDEGTVERTLVINRGEGWHYFITMRGKEIIAADLRSVDGDEFENIGFNIDGTSNVRFQFEYETDSI